jgi:hypothetical protein
MFNLSLRKSSLWNKAFTNCRFMSTNKKPKWNADLSNLSAASPLGEEPRFLDQVYGYFDEAGKYSNATPSLLAY